MNQVNSNMPAKLATCSKNMEALITNKPNLERLRLNKIIINKMGIKSQQTWISLLNRMTQIVRIGQHNKRHVKKSYEAKCQTKQK